MAGPFRQHVMSSSADTMVWAWVWTQIRSEMTLAVDTAQQEPQWLWSQIVPMDLQCPHFFRASKDSGPEMDFDESKSWRLNNLAIARVP